MVEQNEKRIAEKGKKYNFLLDTSAILYFQKMWEHSGVSIFEVFKELPEVEFFVCNDVLSELISGKKGLPPTQLGTFISHVLNSESSMKPGWKENRFLITENGQTKYIVLNKITPTDFAQIILCQNHPKLILVVNDKKMLRSGSRIIHERIIGIPALLNRLLDVDPENERLKTLRDTGNKIFKKKHALGGRKER